MALSVGLLLAPVTGHAETDEARWRAMMEPASVAHLTGAYDEAEFRYLEALALAEDFDKAGEFLERSMAGLGGVYYSQRRYGEAAAFYREALGLATTLYGDDHTRRAVIEIYRETLAAAEAALRAPETATQRSALFVFSKEGSAIPLRGRLPTGPVLAAASAPEPAPATDAAPRPEVLSTAGGGRPTGLPSYLPVRGMPVAVFEAKLAAKLGWAPDVALAKDGNPAVLPSGPVAAAEPAEYGTGPLVIRITPRKPAPETSAKPARGQVAPADPAALRALEADPIAPPNISPSAIVREQAEEIARRRELVKRHPVLGIQLPSAKRNSGPIFPETPRLADTEQAYVEELEARQVAYGSRNPQVADLLYRLARLYHRQSRYELAATMYERCLAAREKVLPEGHPDIIETYKHYIRLMRASGFSEKAAELKDRLKAHEAQAVAVKEP